MLDEMSLKRLKLLRQECLKYNDAPQGMPKDVREDFAWYFSAVFKDFKDFAELGMRYLGFNISAIQKDISDFMQHGGEKVMVQAQRGQAKSTLASLYSIWLLIHKPSTRVLIVSAGETQANEIANLIVRLIMTWDILCWLRPDASRGDRTSSTNFDVHIDLKGIDKSASVVSIGITANLQGKRADFVLLDDVETQKNSATQTMRDTLLLYTKEFAAICISGRIMYLGTPQSRDSVYKSLPKRGYRVRIWTGRYPTNEELQRYGAGTEIAPIIMGALLANPELQTGGGIDGNMGQPTDPEHISEVTLQEKFLEYQDEGFALQYMLDTTLADANRQKLKLSDLIVLNVDSSSVPETVSWNADPKNLCKDLPRHIADQHMFMGVGASDVYVPLEHKVMTLDPAGTNNKSGTDEMAYNVLGATASYLYILGTGGLLGGCTEENMHFLLCRMIEDDVKQLMIERNMGAGAVTALFTSEVDKLRLKCDINSQEPEFLAMLGKYGHTHKTLLEGLRGVSVGDYTSTGQKEKRIIDVIQPVIRRHRMIVTVRALQEDYEMCLKYPESVRTVYSLFYQIANITYDRGSLIHDDRVDVLEGGVRTLQGFLARDDERAAEVRKEQDFQEWLRNPMGIPDYSVKGAGRSGVKVRRGRKVHRVGRR